MASTLKTTKITDKDADGKPKLDADGAEIKKDVADRFMAEFWIAAGYADLEPVISVYPCLTQPARGALPVQEVRTQIDFTPSDVLKAMILKEVKAAVDAELEK